MEHVNTNNFLISNVHFGGQANASWLDCHEKVGERVLRTALSRSPRDGLGACAGARAGAMRVCMRVCMPADETCTAPSRGICPSHVPDPT